MTFFVVKSWRNSTPPSKQLILDRATPMLNLSQTAPWSMVLRRLILDTSMRLRPQITYESNFLLVTCCRCFSFCSTAVVASGQWFALWVSADHHGERNDTSDYSSNVFIYACYKNIYIIPFLSLWQIIVIPLCATCMDCYYMAHLVRRFVYKMVRVYVANWYFRFFFWFFSDTFDSFSESFYQRNFMPINNRMLVWPCLTIWCWLRPTKN